MAEMSERDLRGYGEHPPNAHWPGGATVALNFVMNFEEGSEYSIADGDGRSEGALLEVANSRVPTGQRDLAAESMYEYGVRVGFWRLRNLFVERGLPLTVFACAFALERNPEAAAAIAAAGWDICCHGWRWVEMFRLSEEDQRLHIQRAIASLQKSVGRGPFGWYCRYAPSEAMRRLIVESGSFLYDSDAYNDDLPYWVQCLGRSHLVIPYSLAVNDTKFFGGGLVTAGMFFEYLRDTLDTLREEGKSRPRMMNVGMHLRILGHPGRAAGLARFLDYAGSLNDVWICQREEIARHWMANFSPQAPSSLSPLTDAAIAPFGEIIKSPAMPGDRAFYTKWLGSERLGMTPRLHVNRLAPTALPYRIDALERHPHTAQMFIPLDVSRYVVVVAPNAPDGSPDVTRLQAFLAPGNAGIVYRKGVWHAGATVLDRPGSFAVLMWRNDSRDDEEFTSLGQAIELS